MVLNLYSLAPIAGPVTRPVRNCPTLQHSVVPQPEVVVKARRIVFLNNEEALPRCSTVPCPNLVRTPLLSPGLAIRYDKFPLYFLILSVRFSLLSSLPIFVFCSPCWLELVKHHAR
jgi:hypothetical protein